MLKVDCRSKEKLYILVVFTKQIKSNNGGKGMKITKLQAGIILKLNSIHTPLKNPMDLAMLFERDYKYMCEQLRLMKRRGLIREHKRGIRKFFEVFDKNALELAKTTLNLVKTSDFEVKKDKKEVKK